MKQIKRLQLGKGGLHKGFISQVKKFFEKEEVVKITILRSACRNKDSAREMCDELVKCLGKNYSYRLVGYVATVRKFRRAQR